MAAKYFYRMFGTEFGPVGFRDLVRMVRSGELDADDLVKAEWDREWRPAAQVIGLFHTAGRKDVLALWEAEHKKDDERKARDELEPDGAGDENGAVEFERMLRVAESLAREEQETQRPKQVEAQQVHGREDYGREGGILEQSGTNDFNPQVKAAIDEAVRVKEEKEITGSRRLAKRAEAVAIFRAGLHRVFCWGVALGVANSVAFGVVRWSETQLQRYPEPKAVASGIRDFPFWGRCEPGKYALLLCTTMIVSGAAGYGGVRLVEGMSDD